MIKGVVCFCPIAMSHPVAEFSDVPHMGQMWYDYDNIILDRCDGIIVLMLEGWSDSAGVQAEIYRMNYQKKPVLYLQPGEYDDVVATATAE